MRTIILGVSRSTDCRFNEKVSAAISGFREKYVYIYRNEAEMGAAAEEFYMIESFSRVIGAIDCTIMKIDSPEWHDAENSRSKKSYFVINVQLASDVWECMKYFMKK